MKLGQLIKSDENKISIFERKVLRSVYGPEKVSGEWRIRYSHKLYQLCNEPEIIQEIRAASVRWMEHIFTTDYLPLLKTNIYKSRWC